MEMTGHMAAGSRAALIPGVGMQMLVLFALPVICMGQSSSCRFTNDGRCDEPFGASMSTGRCPAGTDRTDCANACRYANNGQCDHGVRCPAGTDTADCPDASHQSSAYSRSDENGFEEMEDEERDEWDDTNGVRALVTFIVFLTVMFFPCIVFSCAWCTCVNQHRIQGATAVGTPAEYLAPGCAARTHGFVLLTRAFACCWLATQVRGQTTQPGRFVAQFLDWHSCAYYMACGLCGFSCRSS